MESDRKPDLNAMNTGEEVDPTSILKLARGGIGPNSIGAATHAYCDVCEDTVPLLFDGFYLLSGKNDHSVGGDIMCSQCGFIIATLSRRAPPHEMLKLSLEQ